MSYLLTSGGTCNVHLVLNTCRTSRTPLLYKLSELRARHILTSTTLHNSIYILHPPRNVSQSHPADSTLIALTSHTLNPINTMVLSLDPEVATAMAPIIQAMASLPKLEAGDVQGRRTRAAGGLAAIINNLPDQPSVKRTNHSVKVSDGTTITVAEFRKTGSPKPSKAILYIHGGGMIFGSVDVFHKSIASTVARTGVTTFAVGYRLAPEHPHPTPVTDCFDALVWLSTHADELGVDPGRIILQGGSAGGGLAAGTALMARDKGLYPPLAKQILIFPMLDDRNLEALEGIEELATWKVDDSKFLLLSFFLSFEGCIFPIFL